LLGAGITLSIGLGIGAVAGYYGGWRDDLLMRLAELFLALPWLYLLFALRAFLPLAVSPLEAFLLIVVVIATVGWARPARLVRGVVLTAKERDFVRAARGFGASDSYVFCRHVLPETSSVLLTQAAILVPQYVLAEMTLSFLGLGVPEPVASWGNLLANLQQYSVLMSYWWMYLPALAVAPFFMGYLGLAAALQERADSRKMGSWSQESIA
jgi:peptide/nickel transport system permease protein